MSKSGVVFEVESQKIIFKLALAANSFYESSSEEKQRNILLFGIKMIDRSAFDSLLEKGKIELVDDNHLPFTYYSSFRKIHFLFCITSIPIILKIANNKLGVIPGNPRFT